MSDSHRGMPHDLPEYVPNWPVAVKVKAKVCKGFTGWLWSHQCPHREAWGGMIGYPSQPAAFEAALKHARGCW